jgi:hypothetical protein
LHCAHPCRSRRSDLLPNGERIPNVRVERLLCDGACCWTRQLVQVQDDLESRYLAAQRSKLEFALTVPNHGEAVRTLLDPSNRSSGPHTPS